VSADVASGSYVTMTFPIRGFESKIVNQPESGGKLKAVTLLDEPVFDEAAGVKPHDEFMAMAVRQWEGIVAERLAVACDCVVTKDGCVSNPVCPEHGDR